MNLGTLMQRLRGWVILVQLVWIFPAAVPAQPWKFVVFGDSISVVSETGVNTDILGEVAGAIVRENPSFVVFAGDCAYVPLPSSLSLWTNIMGPVYDAGIPVFTAVGNHEAADLAVFTNFFSPLLPDNGPSGEKGETYFVGYSNALVLVLNEFAPGNDYRVNQAWIEEVLATNNRPHVIAVGHMPAFKLVHADCLGAYPASRDIFWNTLSNAHCRLYLCGHDHFYDHSRLEDGDGNAENDLHQIIVGTGGALLFADGNYDGTNAMWTPVRVYHDAQFGYLTVTINEDTVTTAWHGRLRPGVYAEGADVFTYSTTPKPFLAWSYSVGRLVLTWTAGAILQSAPEPNGPFSNVTGASPPYPVELASSGHQFFRLVTK